MTIAVNAVAAVLALGVVAPMLATCTSAFIDSDDHNDDCRRDCF